MMRPTTLSPALLALALALPGAFAAGVPMALADPADVDVNLEALGLRGGADTGSGEAGGTIILRYPGSETATRVVPPLRYPDVPAPVQRPEAPPARAAAASSEPAPSEPAPAARETAAAPDPQPAPAPAPQAAADPQSTAPEAAASEATAPETVDAPPARPVTAAAPAPAEQPAAPAPEDAPPPEDAPVEAAPAQPADPRARVAALTPPEAPPARSEPAAAIARIAFDTEAAAIVGPARGELNAVADGLRFDPRRIELRAYAGVPGDKSSEARRLSLKRGLAVRAYLIDQGIDPRRIDVRALGGISDTGAPDRVDIAYSGS